MPKILFQRDEFRIVYNMENKNRFVFEQLAGKDAMGDPCWRLVEDSSSHISLLRRVCEHLLEIEEETQGGLRP